MDEDMDISSEDAMVEAVLLHGEVNIATRVRWEEGIESVRGRHGLKVCGMKGRGLKCWGALSHFSKAKHRCGKAEMRLQAGEPDVTVRVVRRWRGRWSGAVPQRKGGTGWGGKGGWGLLGVGLCWTCGNC